MHLQRRWKWQTKWRPPPEPLGGAKSPPLFSAIQKTSLYKKTSSLLTLRPGLVSNTFGTKVTHWGSFVITRRVSVTFCYTLNTLSIRSIFFRLCEFFKFFCGRCRAARNSNSFVYDRGKKVLVFRSNFDFHSRPEILEKNYSSKFTQI